MRFAVAAAVLLTLCTGVARGDDDASAREHYVKGTRAYELGLYDEAIAEYMAAYKAKDDPALLFNLGQAHRLAGHAAEALRLYKTYLSKVPAAENRADVEGKIRELKELVEKQKQPPQTEPSAASGTANPPPAAEPAPPGPAPVAPGAATDASASGKPAPAAAVASAASEGSPPGRGMKLTGIAVAAGGLALLGTGVAFGVLAKQAGDQLTQLDQQHGVFDPSKQSAGQRDQVIEGVCIGVGAAAFATGTILYVLGRRTGDAAITVSPAVAAHSAGATLRMVF
jgi:tetratricopeptide (TPR) repeat protein